MAQERSFRVVGIVGDKGAFFDESGKEAGNESGKQAVQSAAAWHLVLALESHLFGPLDKVLPALTYTYSFDGGLEK
jgi:hypothetical protein